MNAIAQHKLPGINDSRGFQGIDAIDAQIVRRPLSKLFCFVFRRPLKKLLRAFVGRVKERGHINSYSYHELHALIERIFLT